MHSTHAVLLSAHPHRERPEKPIDMFRILEQYRNAQSSTGGLTLDTDTCRRIFDAIEDPAFLHDAQYRLLFANTAYCREAGVKEAEVLGRPYWEVFPAGAGPLPGCRDVTGQTGEEGRQEDVRVGERLFLSKAVVVRDDQGTLRYAMHTLSDVTERRRAESELRAAKEQLEATLDASPDLMFEVGLDGTLYSYHSPHTDLLAARPSEFLGKRVCDILPPEAAEVAMAALQEAHETGVSRGKQYDLQLPQGQMWFELSVARKTMPAQHEPRFIVLSRDISERKVAAVYFAEQIEELRRWHDVTLGRETRILELKHEVNELLHEAGRPVRYPSAELLDRPGE